MINIKCACQSGWMCPDCADQLRAEVERLKSLSIELTDCLEKAGMYLPVAGVPVGFDYRLDQLVSRARGEV